ncbi:uncharacterized protein AMSG_02687 [Thecamonas trahens ATCC 50062]|uniref:DNA-directed RNA polymerase III subunit RPC3 n=1 Tax=Thecamonas trahens ATCC 50062 TaxID=461836 RepID=A0A0L0D207_THETB|nr:hypothetical protein AMSG_02687 [Thecamonas trahens ATCC 50062]KNC46236.1 hypothetical protein AMSG_02687 [Thecamonas trahens ATCC 50062]|eukprot:XP_013760533.1 hypothetical protein AMSG_02687 [Thecamonas trahens ATCC 50062]
MNFQYALATNIVSAALADLIPFRLVGVRYPDKAASLEPGAPKQDKSSSRKKKPITFRAITAMPELLLLQPRFVDLVRRAYGEAAALALDAWFHLGLVHESEFISSLATLAPHLPKFADPELMAKIETGFAKLLGHNLLVHTGRPMLFTPDMLPRKPTKSQQAAAAGSRRSNAKPRKGADEDTINLTGASAGLSAMFNAVIGGKRKRSPTPSDSDDDDDDASAAPAQAPVKRNRLEGKLVEPNFDKLLKLLEFSLLEAHFVAVGGPVASFVWQAAQPDITTIVTETKTLKFAPPIPKSRIDDVALGTSYSDVEVRIVEVLGDDGEVETRREAVPVEKTVDAALVEKTLVRLQLLDIRFLRRSNATGQYILSFDAVRKHLHETATLSIIRSRYGPLGLRIVSVLREQQHAEETALTRLAMAKPKEVRLYLNMLIKDGFVVCRQVPRNSEFSSNKSFYLFSYDPRRAHLTTAALARKTMSNMLVRAKADTAAHAKLIDMVHAFGSPDSLNDEERERWSAFEAKRNKLFDAALSNRHLLMVLDI